MAEADGFDGSRFRKTMKDAVWKALIGKKDSTFAYTAKHLKEYTSKQLGDSTFTENEVTINIRVDCDGNLGCGEADCPAEQPVFGKTPATRDALPSTRNAVPRA